MPDFGIVCRPQLMHDRQTAMIGKLFKGYSPRFPNRVLSEKKLSETII